MLSVALAATAAIADHQLCVANANPIPTGDVFANSANLNKCPPLGSSIHHLVPICRRLVNDIEVRAGSNRLIHNHVRDHRLPVRSSSKLGHATKLRGVRGDDDGWQFANLNFSQCRKSITLSANSCRRRNVQHGSLVREVAACHPQDQGFASSYNGAFHHSQCCHLQRVLHPGQHVPDRLVGKNPPRPVVGAEVRYKLVPLHPLAWLHRAHS
mmetsp:Transcript_97579/g.176283  ORF Transcript_97579/g.176283 Transcript_97579/m.176283 type:complete len:212 (-) Transcript_97579:67-702(-)